MATTLEEVLEDALELPEDSRAVLVEHLIGSLPSDPAIQEEQLPIVRRRAEELRGGSVKGIPGEEALRLVREAVAARRKA
jgi:putative addiction module component (TIGR02574 family)